MMGLRPRPSRPVSKTRYLRNLFDITPPAPVESQYIVRESSLPDFVLKRRAETSTLILKNCGICSASVLLSQLKRRHLLGPPADKSLRGADLWPENEFWLGYNSRRMAQGCNRKSYRFPVVRCSNSDCRRKI